MTGYIYCHTSPSGKKYIGQTCLAPERRWRKGLAYKGSPVFYQAINKYGWENFSHKILEIIEDKKEGLLKKLNEREIYWISKYNTVAPNGYNLELGGNGIGKRDKQSLQKQSCSKLNERVPSKEKLFSLYIIEKKSIKATAEILGISSGAVSNWLDWYEIPKHGFGPQKNKIVGIKKEELYDLYINKRLSQQKIATLFGVSKATIGRRLKEYGIPVKPPHRYKEEAI